MDGQIRDIRRAKGLRQEALAQKAGVHRTTVSRYERGIGPRGPTRETDRRLREALDGPSAADIAALPAIPRMSLVEFLERLADILRRGEVVGLRSSEIPMQVWIKWCQHALMELGERQ